MDTNLIISVVIQLLGIAFLAGVGWMKIDALEEDIERLEKEVVDSRTVAARLLVLETKLELLNSKLDQFFKHEVR